MAKWFSNVAVTGATPPSPGGGWVLEDTFTNAETTLSSGAIPVSTGTYTYAFYSPVGEPGASGSTGLYTFGINVTTGSSTTGFTATAQIHRVNSSGVVQTSSATTAISTTAGWKNPSFSAQSLGTWAAGDRLRIDVKFTNTNTMSAITVALGVNDGKSAVLAPWYWNYVGAPITLDRSAWVNLNTAETVNAVVAPDGTTTAEKITETATSTQHRIQNQTIPRPGVAATYTSSLFVKAAERTWVQFETAANGSAGVWTTVNCTTGQITTTQRGAYGSWTLDSESMTDMGNGWWRVATTFTTTTLSGFNCFIYLKNSEAVDSYLGVVGSGLYLWGMAIEPGSVASDYPGVASGTAYSVTVTPASIPIVGATIAPAAAYNVTVTPAAVPVVGSTVASVFGRTTTITPASVPISGATVSPVKAVAVTVTPAAVPISGSTVNPTYGSGTSYSITITAAGVPIDGATVAPVYGRTLTITPAAVPISGSSVTPVYARFVSITAAAVPIVGATVNPSYGSGTSYSITIAPAGVPIDGASVAPAYGRTTAITLAAVPISGASVGTVYGRTTTITPADVPIDGSSVSPTYAPGGVPWTPVELGSKLEDWWPITTTPASVTTSTGVSSVANAGNRAYSLDQGTGSLQPPYSSTSLNGYYGATFDGSDDYLSTSGAWADALTEPWGLHMLLKVVSLPGSTKTIFGGETGWFGGVIDVTSGGDIVYYAGGAGGYTLATVAAGDFVILSLTANGASSTAFTNGSALSGPSLNPGATSQGGFSLGRNHNGTQCIAMVLGDVVTTSGALTTGEQNQLDGFLAWSADLASLLPSGHPYKSSPPMVAGGNYTTTLAPASIPIAGTSVGTVFGRTATITPASVPISGASVAPVHARAVTVTPAAVPIDGAAVSPAYGRTLTTTPASVPIVGATLTSVFGRAATITSASVPIVGSSVTPFRAYTVSVTPAAVPIVGSTVSPFWTVPGGITIQPGTVPITGQTVNDVHARFITITSASVPISGATITPRFGRTLTITAASVPITGATVTPVFFGSTHYSITVTAAGVPIVGADVAGSAALRTSLTPAAVPILGQPLALLRGFGSNITAATVPIVGAVIVPSLVFGVPRRGPTKSRSHSLSLPSRAPNVQNVSRAGAFSTKHRQRNAQTAVRNGTNVNYPTRRRAS